VGRTSAFSFKGKNDDLRSIGQKLGVANLLEGSVRKAGNRIRITAQLIEVSNGFHLWSQKFDRELIDIFDVQDEISKAIVDQLMAELTRLENPAVSKTPGRNVEAYNLFLKGRFYWSKRNADGFKKSISFYEEAINIEPEYAAAYAAMSDSYSLICAYHNLSPEDSILKAREIAQKAVAINKSLAEGYEAIGHVELLYDWNWEKARQYYAQAIKLNPAYATALQRNALLSALFDKYEEAMEGIMMAVHHEPLSLIINTDVAIIYFIQRNYTEAIKKCLTVFEIDPAFGVALFICGLSYEQLGQFDQAISYLQKAWEVSHNYIGLGALIHAMGKSGKKEEAMDLLKELKHASSITYVSPYTFACAYLGLGDLTIALELLEEAVNTHSVWLVHLHMKSDPRIDPLRSEKRFKHLLAKMGLH
jgi:tetratricopeptide (TPR) repeat protein